MTMEIFELRKGQVLPLRNNIEKLTSHHSAEAGGRGKLMDHLHPPGGGQYFIIHRIRE